MAFKVITLRSAETDVENAVEWCEEQNPSLGVKFFNEILACLYKLTESPQHYGYAYKSFRQIVLPTFPYKIIYFISVNEVIVHAVFHVRQNPKN